MEKGVRSLTRQLKELPLIITEPPDALRLRAAGPSTGRRRRLLFYDLRASSALRELYGQVPRTIARLPAGNQRSCHSRAELDLRRYECRCCRRIPAYKAYRAVRPSTRRWLRRA